MGLHLFLFRQQRYRPQLSRALKPHLVTNRWRCRSWNRSVTAIPTFATKCDGCLSLCVSQRAKEGFPLKAERVAPGVVFFFTSPNLCQTSRAALWLWMTLCNYLIHTWSPYRLDKGQRRLSAEACECRAAERMYCKYDSPPLNPNSCWWILNNASSVCERFKSIQIS